MQNINNDVLSIMKFIESCGYECYITGGFVRDLIIGRKSNDYDLCTNMPLEELKIHYPLLAMMCQNDRRKTGIITLNNMDVELTEFRGKDLYEDLLLRDITINSIAMDCRGKIYDPMNGISDIKNKIIRYNRSSIEYDSCAILRSIRFEGVLGYEIDSKSLDTMYQYKHNISNVAIERLRKELFKILLCDNAGTLFSKYRDIFFDIIPELKNLVDFDNGDGVDLFEHTMSVVNKVDSNLYLRFAALFHDVGKINYDENYTNSSIEYFSVFARRFKFDKTTKYIIKKLIFFHNVSLDSNEKTMAKFISEIGPDNLNLLFDLKLADICVRNDDVVRSVNEMNNLRNTYLKFLETKPVLGFKDLQIDGKSLSQMNFDSKFVSIILNDILNKVMNFELENNKDKLEEYVNEKYR